MTEQDKARVEEVTMEVARRLHTKDRSIIRIVKEISPVNCSWEELSEHHQKRYITEAITFLMSLESMIGIISDDQGLPDYGKEFNDLNSWIDKVVISRIYTRAHQNMLASNFVKIIRVEE